MMDYRDYLQFDSRLFAKAVATSGLAAARVFALAGQRRRSFQILATLHRSAFSTRASQVAERRLQSELDAAADSRDNILDEHLRNVRPDSGTNSYFKNPERLLGTRLIVLKAPAGAERGLLIFDYTPFFPLLPRLFHADKILARYHLVLEPSWTGFCDLDLVSASRFADPVFVQVLEPRDRQFIDGLGPRFVPIPITMNWWADYRVFRPIPGAKKEVDLIMIASWARFKRHEQFFTALARLKARGVKLRAALVGYPNGLTKENVLEMARRRGLDDQIEIHESLTPEGVNRQFNRARANIVWSRREGVNRAIIEGMLAGLPGVLRRGFNYGHPYPFINDATGSFADEHDLPDVLVRLLERADTMQPRDWILQNMSVDHAAAAVNAAVQTWSDRARQPWSSGLVKKVGFLNAMRYWDEADQQRFEPDYQFLRSQIRAAAV